MKNDAKRLFNNNIKVLQTTPYSLEVILNFTNGMIRAHNVMCNSIQIMNGYECNGTDIFMRLEMECSIQRGIAELNRTFHL